MALHASVRLFAGMRRRFWEEPQIDRAYPGGLRRRWVVTMEPDLAVEFHSR